MPFSLFKKKQKNKKLIKNLKIKNDKNSWLFPHQE